MTKTQTVPAPRLSFARTLPSVDAWFFLGLGVLAVAIGVGAIIR